MEVGGERSDIYIHGIGDTEFKWYRVQFLTADLVNKPCGGPAEMTPKKISSVATLCQSTHGSAGSWDVIGDDIYWVGGFKYHTRGITLCNELLRHKVNDADPSSWEVVSSSIRLPSKSRFLAAVGTKKLCVVGGEDYRGHLPFPSDDDDSWRHCGAIYDLEKGTWTYLQADYKDFSDYDTSKEVAVVVDNNNDVGGEEPTRIVFYSCRTGSTLFLDVPSGKVDGPVTRANFNPWQDPSNEPGPDIRRLLFVTDFVRPVFTNNTFYWLTPQLHLLGYDIIDQAWLRSPSLEGKLPSLIDCSYPIVVGLQEGKLLAVISPALGGLMVASLTVTKAGNFLSVSVDLVQPLSLDDDSFMPFDGKAIHGALHLPEGESLPQGGQCSLQSLSLAIQQDIGFLSEIDLEKDESKVLSVESSEHSKLKILFEENEVVGFDWEANTVLDRLFKGTTDLEVIPVVGMPGLGKTTLASKIYKDPRTLSEFFWLSWVYVGQNYELKEVLVSILKEFSRTTAAEYGDLKEFTRTTAAEYGDLKEFTRTTTAEYGDMTVNELAKKIRVLISKGGRCLIVLDDVWATDVIDYVKKVFPENRKRHRIMITTREGHIGRHAKANPHSLKFLTDKESFQLLENIIFRSNSRWCSEELVLHGKSIAKQCSGLPLAVVVIARALKGSTDQKEWKIVKENMGHLRNEDPESCLKIVKMSYDLLPNDMKRCFLYCAAFPRGFEIPAWKLIRLWIAEKLINSKLKACPEDIAEEYLYDLVNRSLLTVMKKKADGQVKTCRLHDTLHQFCKMEANKMLLLWEVCEKPDRTGFDLPEPRLFYYSRLCIQLSLLKAFISKIKGQAAYEYVNSFLCFSTRQKGSEQLTDIQDLHEAFPRVRVLDIESLKTSFLRDFQGRIQLRYLAISGDYEALPAFFGKFLDLETLVLNTVHLTIEIKADIWNMPRLRHLHTNVPAKLLSPATRTVDEPSCLQTLSKVAPESCREDVLARACTLRKVTVQGPMDGFFYTNEFENFKKLNCLEQLKLLNDIGGSRVLPFPPAFVEVLHKLKKLTLSNTRFAWSDAEKLGRLECLEVLKLKENAFVGNFWYSEGFSQLKVLWIQRANFKFWEASNVAFQRLKCLVLISCDKLEAVPSELAGVSSLQEMTLEYTTKANKSANYIKSKKEMQERMQKLAGSNTGAKTQASEISKFKLNIFPRIAEC